MKEMTLDEIKAVSLDILQDVHEFCVQNNIKYSLYGGTAIGAIRHQGFIPWDDDIDIGMPRPDYERFINSYKSDNYQLLSRETEGGKDVLISFSRVCEMKRTYVDSSSNPWTKRETGVWIDVFPLDGVEDDYDECEKRIEKMKKVWNKCWVLRYSTCSWSHVVKNGLKSIVKQFGRKLVVHLTSNPIDKHISMCRKVSWEESRYFANISYMAYGICERHSKQVFDEVLLATFEGYEFYIMGGYDEALKEKYGNYMQLPPENERTGGHSVNIFYWR